MAHEIERAMSKKSKPAPDDIPTVREVFNQHIWVLGGVTDCIAQSLADLPGTHGRDRFGVESYDIEVDPSDEGEWLGANSRIATRLQNSGFGFWDAKEMSPVGHIRWLKNAGLIEGEFFEIYVTRTRARRLRPF